MVDQLELLKNLLIYVGENEKELIFKCPNHDDKNYKKNKGHFYVSKNTYSFICFKCGIHGKNVFSFLIHNYYKLPNLNPNKISFQSFVEHFVKNNYLMVNNLDTNFKNEIVKVNNEQKEQKMILFNDLINEMYRITLNRKDTIFDYFKIIRKINDVDFVNNLIETKKVLLFRPDKKFNTLIKEIYNVEVSNLTESGICINYSSFNDRIRTMNLQIRFFSNTFRYLNLKNDDGTIIIDNRKYDVPFYSVFFLEGPFDVIKLWYLLLQSNVDFNYIIHMLGGKNNSKSLYLLNDYVLRLKYEINKVMILLDNDITHDEVIDFVTKLQKVMEIQNNKIYVRQFKDKNIKDLDLVSNLNDSVFFVKYDLFRTGLYQLIPFSTYKI